MDLDLVVKTLNASGKIVAIKTDTVYGFICNAFDKKATEKIYLIKHREKRKPLSIFVKNIDEIKKYVSSDNITLSVERLMKKYWPGALTIVFKKKDNTFDHITENSSGIGIRIPDDDDLLSILNSIQFPLAQTSCNVSGEREYKSASEIKERFGDEID